MPAATLAMRLKQVIRRAISSAPRSRLVYRACKTYCDQYDNDGSENDGNPQTNGEYRLLREIAPQLNAVFDVGANVGDWTAMLLELARRPVTVYAFEPSSATYRILETRSFPENVRLAHAGLSSEPGEARLFVATEGAEQNSLYQREGLEDGWGVERVTATESVQLDTLDRFCASRGISEIDLVKIDTEGHEVSVLQGSLRMLGAGRIKMLQFEYGGAYIDSRRLLKDVFDLFLGLPYTLFVITPPGLRACRRYDQRLENFQYKNLIAIRTDVVPAIASARAAFANTTA